MSRYRRPARRALVCLCAIIAAAGAAPGPAGASDLEALREEAQEIADDVTGLERDLDYLRARAQSLDAQIRDANLDIAALELESHTSEVAAAAARERYVARAVEAYKRGPDASLALLLSAEDVDDLVTLAGAASASAHRDSTALARYQATQAEAERAQSRLELRKARLLAARAEAAEVAAGIDVALERRRAALAELVIRIDELEAQARAAAARKAARAASEDQTTGGPTAISDEARSGAGQQPPASAGPGRDDASGSRPAAAARPPGAPAPSRFIGTGVSFQGIASWYGPGFAGNLTASGDVFHPMGFTAASRDLPLGTWLRVGYGGRSVIVLVNDRGPYIESRVLDLSQGAAEYLGISGLGWVRAEIVLER